MTLTAKVPIPVDEKPDFNWVGRIIGPGGVTLKNLENKSGCKVSLRGKGSVRESEVRATAARQLTEWITGLDFIVRLMCEDAVDRLIASRLQCDSASCNRWGLSVHRYNSCFRSLLEGRLWRVETQYG